MNCILILVLGGTDIDVWQQSTSVGRAKLNEAYSVCKYVCVTVSLSWHHMIVVNGIKCYHHASNFFCFQSSLNDNYENDEVCWI